MLRFGANLTMLFSELPTLERFAAARDAGFTHVEFQFPDREPSFDDFADAADAAGVKVIQFNMTIGPGSVGGAWLGSDPAATGAFAEALGQAARQSNRLGGAMVTVHIGKPIDGVERERQLDTFRANIELAANRLADEGALVLFEALNSVDNPGWLIDSQLAGAELVREVGHPNLGLQFDAYHAHMAGEDLIEVYNSTIDVTRHIQFADAPGRHQPGTGVVDLAAFFAAVDASPFGGWLNAEYWPEDPTLDTLGWFTPSAE